MKICFIEDNDADYFLIKNIIKENFHDLFIKRYYYLNDFLNSKNNYDLILADLGLPDAYGPIVLKKIREITNKPIIVLSSVGGKNISNSILDTIMNEGATIFLSKQKDEITSIIKILKKFI